MFMKSIYITWVFSKQLFLIYQGLCMQKAYENYINWCGVMLLQKLGVIQDSTSPLARRLIVKICMI